MVHEAQDTVVAWWREGRFRPVTTEVVSFDAVPEACTAIAERRTRGRVVVEVTPGAAGQA